MARHGQPSGGAETRGYHLDDPNHYTPPTNQRLSNSVLAKCVHKAIQRGAGKHLMIAVLRYMAETEPNLKL